MKLRQIVFTLHRYVGVMVGLLLLVIGLTGSALVFWHEINHFLNPQLLQVVPQGEQVSVQSVLDTVRLAYPDWKLSYIDLPQKLNSVYTVGLEAKNEDFIYVYLNPYTGAMLGSQQWGRTLMTFIYDLHYNLLAGKVGEKVVGTCGLLLLLLGVTGLILWPGWRKLITGFKIRWHSPSRLVNYDLHKVVGLLSVVLLNLIAFTGAAMIFYTEFEQVTYWLTGTPKPPELKSTLVAGKPPMSLDRLLQKADVALPGAKTTFISLPAEPNGVVRARKKFPQEGHPNGRSNIYLDQYSGEVLQVDNALEAPLAQRVLNALFPLHIGVYGGLSMRIFYIFIGFTPTVLYITGFKLWRHRQWDQARRREAIRQVQRVQS